MGNMHKETIGRKKLPSLLKIFSVLILSLYGIEIMDEYESIAATMACALLTITLICEIKYCRIKYTYSIIADQFIIHKISGNEDKVVENIKIWDIQDVGQEGVLASRKNIFNSKRYICSVFNIKPYYCNYKHGNRIKTFYFEPSKDLVDKIIFNKDKERIAC